MTVTDRALQRAAAIVLNISWTSFLFQFSPPFFILFWHVQRSSAEKKVSFLSISYQRIAGVRQYRQKSERRGKRKEKRIEGFRERRDWWEMRSRREAAETLSDFRDKPHFSPWAIFLPVLHTFAHSCCALLALYSLSSEEEAPHSWGNKDKKGGLLSQVVKDRKCFYVVFFLNWGRWSETELRSCKGFYCQHSTLQSPFYNRLPNDFLSPRHEKFQLPTLSQTNLWLNPNCPDFTVLADSLTLRGVRQLFSGNAPKQHMLKFNWQSSLVTVEIRTVVCREKRRNWCDVVIEFAEGGGCNGWMLVFNMGDWC